MLVLDSTAYIISLCISICMPIVLYRSPPGIDQYAATVAAFLHLVVFSLFLVAEVPKILFTHLGTLMAREGGVRGGRDNISCRDLLQCI